MYKSSTHTDTQSDPIASTSLIPIEKTGPANAFYTNPLAA